MLFSHVFLGMVSWKEVRLRPRSGQLEEARAASDPAAADPRALFEPGPSLQALPQDQADGGGSPISAISEAEREQALASREFRAARLCVCHLARERERARAACSASAADRAAGAGAFASALMATSSSDDAGAKQSERGLGGLRRHRVRSSWGPWLLWRQSPESNRFLLLGSLAAVAPEPGVESIPSAARGHGEEARASHRNPATGLV